MKPYADRLADLTPLELEMVRETLKEPLALSQLSREGKAMAWNLDARGVLKIELRLSPNMRKGKRVHTRYTYPVPEVAALLSSSVEAAPVAPVAPKYPTATRTDRSRLAPLVKIRLHGTGETFCFALYERETVLDTAREQTELEELEERDYEVLGDADVTREEWEGHLQNELEGENATRVASVVEEALPFMTDEGAVAFVKYMLASFA